MKNTRTQLKDAQNTYEGVTQTSTEVRAQKERDYKSSMEYLGQW